MSDIYCLPLKQVTDGPLFSAGPGTLSALVNMELRPGGYAEARGGFEELKPNGGTAADAITTGGYSDAIQFGTSLGWVRQFNSAAGAGSQYSANWRSHPGNYLPFATGVVNDAIYFGADAQFSRIGIQIVLDATWTVTLVYEYWNGAAWTALTMVETPGAPFNSAFAPQVEYYSWTLPTNWAATTVGDSGTGNVLKYWMRIRISVSTLITTLPTISNVVGNWVGIRELYTTTHDPYTSGITARIRRHGQTGTTEEWFTVASALHSIPSSPARMAAYKNRVMMVNGIDKKVWDGFSSRDIGLAKPGTGTTATASGGAAAGLGTGVWRVYIAFGYGPIKYLGANYSNWPGHGFNWEPLYGFSQARYVGEVITTAGANAQITVDWTALTIGSNVSALAIYMTDNITGVDVDQRPNMPAFLWDTLNKRELAAGTNTVLGATFFSKLFPQLEAIMYQNLPPENPKFVAVYQNRLLLGDDEYWYWSDPFTPDVFTPGFNYIALAKSTGGRHMGGLEFGDQVVLWTEEQTWGLTNIDMDVPQLFPIALGIGCVAPDAACVVDGLLIWPARDGFYAWDGKGEPYKISGKMKETFGKMSFEGHGGSKATGHNRRYDVRLSNPDYSTIGTAWRFNLDSGEWNEISTSGFASTLFPLATMFAPLGNNDAGYLHPIWGKVDYGTGAGEYGLFLGELTTQDAGSNYTCSATMHYPLKPGEVITPVNVKAYYQAADGWGTPSFTFATADVIGSAVGTLNTGTADTGSDYSIIAGTFSAVARGTSDLKVTFSVLSAASGTVNRQRLFGAILKGDVKPLRRGGV